MDLAPAWVRLKHITLRLLVAYARGTVRLPTVTKLEVASKVIVQVRLTPGETL